MSYPRTIIKQINSGVKVLFVSGMPKTFGQFGKPGIAIALNKKVKVK